MGTQSPPKREAEAGAEPPIFDMAIVAERLDGSRWHLAWRRLGPVHIVLDGDTAPLPKTGGRAPQFSADLYCGQTAGCIKMPLGTEVGLGLRDIVFEVDPATPEKGHTHPTKLSAHVYCG